jgi:hypothetical protein
MNLTPCVKHTNEFKGNKQFSQVSYGPSGTRIRMSIKGVYVCKVCGKTTVRAPRNDAPFPDLRVPGSST